jgi:hypothetical protein
MPFNRLQETENLRSQLNQIEDFKINYDADMLISVELLLFTASQLDINVSVESLWSLCSGYDYPIIPKYKDIKIIDHLRVLVPEFRTKQIWLIKLKEYWLVPEKYRLYSSVGSSIIIKNNDMKYLTNRDKIYSELLTNELSPTKNDSDFLIKGDFEYLRTINSVRYSFKGSINEEYKTTRLPKYRKKGNLSFSLPMDLDDTVKEMDQLNPEGNYSKRLENFSLRSLHQSERKTFNFNGTQHIAGGLSAGKSSWMVIESYRQIKQNGAKLGFVEGSVNQVLSRVMEFRRLGINAVPLIGKGGRKQHEKRFLSYLPNTIEGLEEEHQHLKSVSDTCTIKALAGDFERNNFYPCNSLLQKSKKKKLCPLAHTCGIYHEWTELLDADVWITTASALLMTKIPPAIDQYERTLYEAMYDLLDVIFIDEVDAVQKQFDEKFCVEIDAFGHAGLFFENILEENGRLLTGRYNQFAGNSLIQNWQHNVSDLNKSVWSLFEKLKKSPSIKLKLKSKIVFPNIITSWIIQMVKMDDFKKKKIEAELNSVTKSNSGLGKYYKEFWNNLDKRVDHLQLSYDYLFEGEQFDKEEEIKNMLEFYFYFSKADSHLKYLLQFYPALQNILGMEYNLNHLLAAKKDLSPLMVDAMTGSFIGYRYSESDDGVGKFKIIEYSGVGRLLLTEWTNFFENITGNKGPSIVLLSGTSYAPGSSHYHIIENPKWALLSNIPKSKITQRFINLYDENKEFIKISGSSVGDRPSKLSKLLKTAKNHILQELIKLKVEKRRLLLVVNSYEDVNIVGKVLGNMKEFQGKYKLLTNQLDGTNDDVEYSRFEIEKFRATDEIILVVPLMAISRGYNILDEENGALFGSCFFLVRPYPVPNDMSYIIQTIHSFLPNYLEEIQNLGKQYDEGIRHLRYRSIGRLEMMYQTPYFWKLLNEKERMSLAWYIFIPVWQMIGRMLRGGRDARIYYLDGSFHNASNSELSLLKYWKNYFTNNKQDELFQELYGPFIESIESIIL